MTTRQTGFVAGIAIAAGIGITIFLLLNRGYGQISPGAYKIAGALYSVCLVKSEARLDAIERLLIDQPAGSSQNDSRNAGVQAAPPDVSSGPGDFSDLTPKERKWLNSIVRLARNEKWDSAVAQLRRMLEDQVQK